MVTALDARAGTQQEAGTQKYLGDPFTFEEGGDIGILQVKTAAAEDISNCPFKGIPAFCFA